MPENLNDVYEKLGKLSGRQDSVENQVNGLLAHVDGRFNKVDEKLTEHASLAAVRHEKIETALLGIKEDVSETKVQASHDKGFVVGAFTGSAKTVAVIFAGLVSLGGLIGWVLTSGLLK